MSTTDYQPKTKYQLTNYQLPIVRQYDSVTSHTSGARPIPLLPPVFQYDFKSSDCINELYQKGPTLGVPCFICPSCAGAQRNSEGLQNGLHYHFGTLTHRKPQSETALVPLAARLSQKRVFLVLQYLQLATRLRALRSRQSDYRVTFGACSLHSATSPTSPIF